MHILLSMMSVLQFKLQHSFISLSLCTVISMPVQNNCATMQVKEELPFSVQVRQIRRVAVPLLLLLISIMGVSWRIIVLLHIFPRTLSPVNCNYLIKMSVIHLGFVAKVSNQRILCQKKMLEFLLIMPSLALLQSNHRLCLIS